MSEYGNRDIYLSSPSLAKVNKLYEGFVVDEGRYQMEDYFYSYIRCLLFEDSNSLGFCVDIVYKIQRNVNDYCGRHGRNFISIDINNINEYIEKRKPIRATLTEFEIPLSGEFSKRWRITN